MARRDHKLAEKFIGRVLVDLEVYDRSHSPAVVHLFVKNNVNDVQSRGLLPFMENEAILPTTRERFMPERIPDREIYLLPDVIRLAAARYLLDEGRGKEEDFYSKNPGLKQSIENLSFPTNHDAIVPVIDEMQDAFGTVIVPFPEHWKGWENKIKNQCLPSTDKEKIVLDRKGERARDGIPPCLRKYKHMKTLEVTCDRPDCYIDFMALIPMVDMALDHVKITGWKTDGLGREFPKDMFLLDQVKKIELPGNSIDRITIDYPMENVEYLDLNDNKLHERLSDFMKFPNVKVLKLRNSDINIAKPFEDLKHLEVLDVSRNQDYVISGWRPDIKPFNMNGIGKLKRLKNLDLSGREIKSVPGSELAKLKDLERLNLSGNPITRFPAISRLKRMKELNLSKAELKSIPSSAKSDSIENLNLQDNKIDEIKDLANFTSLKHLNLQNNTLGERWVTKGGSKRRKEWKKFMNIKSNKPLQLESLDLSLNEFDDEINLERIADPSTLKEFRMGYSWIRDADFLKNYTNLEILDIPLTIIEKIPEIVKNSRNLKELNLSHCQIKDMVDLSSLVHLKKLNLSGNKLKGTVSAHQLPLNADTIFLNNNNMIDLECNPIKKRYEKIRGKDAVIC